MENNKKFLAPLKPLNECNINYGEVNDENISNINGTTINDIPINNKSYKQINALNELNQPAKKIIEQI